MKNRIKTAEKNIGFTDLAIASYLSLDFPLLDLNLIEGTKYEFIFSNSLELQKAVDDFYSNHALVNPLTYFNAIKYLKGRIYSRR